MASYKSQAAMEFLMTYGWALLVLLIAIAALSFTGVLNPDKFLADKITVSDNRFQILFGGDDNLLVKNVGDTKLLNVQLNYTTCNGLLTTKYNISEGTSNLFPILCDNVPDSGNKLKTNIDIIYEEKTAGNLLSHIAKVDYAVSGDYLSSENIIEYLPFENNFDEHSSEDNTITNYNGQVNNRYLTLDGTDDYVYSDVTVPSTLSISIWAKATNSIVSDEFLFSFGSTGFDGPGLWFKNSLSPVIAWNTGDGVANQFCDQQSPNQWHNYILITESGNTKLYIDNVLCGTATYKNPSGTGLYIGRYEADTDYWQGDIGNVMLFNKVLTTDEIEKVYKSQLKKYT